MIDDEVREQYIADIGIETHVQLMTDTKLFAAVSSDSRDTSPNTNISPLCLGMPGTLPVLNKKAVMLAIRAGLALNGEIARKTKFDRKNYFYPDLPKGYQISQFDKPIVGTGKITIPLEDGANIEVGITRAHLEEDAGKTLHPSGQDYSLIDLNRAGTPLLEIVSEPDMHSPEEARAYAHELYLIMRYANVSDADLYHGNMRFDVNVSVRKKDQSELGTRTETKNLNSFRSVEKAVEYEIQRQIELLEKGESIQQATLGWDEAKGKTSIQRLKEEAHDYRYFPEPDIPPLVIHEEMIDQQRELLKTLPAELRQRFLSEVFDGNESSSEDVTMLVNNPGYAELILEVIDHVEDKDIRLQVATWITNVVPNYLDENEMELENANINAENLTALAEMTASDKLSSTNAKSVLEVLMVDGGNPEEIAKSNNLLQVSDTSQLEEIVEHVLENNQQAVEDFREGNDNAIGFLIGQVMKESRGQANPQIAREILNDKLR